jgi:hypothetical protein
MIQMSGSRRASVGSSTGVFPERTKWRGPRTEAAGVHKRHRRTSSSSRWFPLQLSEYVPMMVKSLLFNRASWWGEPAKSRHL